MKKLYATGFNNYATHDEAISEFYKCRCAVAVELQKDGNGVIVWLTDSPSAGQCEFVGTQPIYNEAAKALKGA